MKKAMEMINKLVDEVITKAENLKFNISEFHPFGIIITEYNNFKNVNVFDPSTDIFLIL